MEEALLVKNRCCICQKRDKTKDYKVHKGHSLSVCRRCSLVFLSNIPGDLDEFVEAVQSKGSHSKDLEYWSVPDFYEQYSFVFEHFFEQRYERMLLYSLPKGDFLDVGSGFGFWLDFLKKKGHNCFGVDLSAPAINYSKQQNDKFVELTSFEEFQTDKKFAAVFMFDVLEHFERPDLMLNKAHDLLLPGGIIYIQVPNVLGIKIPYGHSLGLPYHLWQFNFKSLKLLFDKSNFSHNLRSWTGIQGVVGAYSRGGPSFLTKISWRAANLFRIGNRIQMIGQKKDK